MNIRIQGIAKGEGSIPVKGEQADQQDPPPTPPTSFSKTIHQALMSATIHSRDFRLGPFPLSLGTSAHVQLEAECPVLEGTIPGGEQDFSIGVH